MRTNKNGDKKYRKNISYILLCIDSARLMTSSLSNLVNNISEGSHKIERKHGDYNKKCETCGIKYKYCNCFLNIQTLKMI